METYIEVSIRKEVKEQIQTLAARQNIGIEQASEDLVRRGLETYLAEQAAGHYENLAMRKEQRTENREE